MQPSGRPLTTSRVSRGCRELAVYGYLRSRSGSKNHSSILGHYSAGFTLDTYTHVTVEMQKEAADRMGGFIAQSL